MNVGPPLLPLSLHFHLQELYYLALKVHHPPLDWDPTPVTSCTETELRTAGRNMVSAAH